MCPVIPQGMEENMLNDRTPALQAHRGVSTDCPENTMAAFRAAVEQGYAVIELDPKFTRDNACVVLHDRTINRTANGGKLEKEIKIADITFEEARSYEYGSWFAPEFAGEPIPLLSQVLEFAKAANIPLKIDNVIESFSDEQTGILFALIDESGAGELAGFTCTKPEYLKKVVARFPKAPVHYDGPVDAGSLEMIKSLLAENPLTVWLPCPNELTGWCSMPKLSHERAGLVRSCGAKLGIWIIESDDDMRKCLEFAPDLIETTGRLKPQ